MKNPLILIAFLIFTAGLTSSCNSTFKSRRYRPGTYKETRNSRSTTAVHTDRTAGSNQAVTDTNATVKNDVPPVEHPASLGDSISKTNVPSSDTSRPRLASTPSDLPDSSSVVAHHSDTLQRAVTTTPDKPQANNSGTNNVSEKEGNNDAEDAEDESESDESDAPDDDAPFVLVVIPIIFILFIGILIARVLGGIF